MRYLLDTCVISELIAKHPQQQVVAWVDSQDIANLYLSVITIGEIRKGVERLPDSPRKISLYTWLNDDLLIRFSGRLLFIDTVTMLHWGTMTASLERIGKPMSALDSLIAAQAVGGPFALVTRNEEDFVHSGVTLINPWKLVAPDPEGEA